MTAKLIATYFMVRVTVGGFLPWCRLSFVCLQTASNSSETLFKLLSSRESSSRTAVKLP